MIGYMTRVIQLSVASVLTLIVLLIFVHPLAIGPPAPQIGNRAVVQVILLVVCAVGLLLLAPTGLNFWHQIRDEMWLQAPYRLALICTRRC
jgi:uncharacterized membrane protein